MKHVAKADLAFRNGYLVDTRTSEVLRMDRLVEQYNEIQRMADLNLFVAENRAALEAEVTPVTFKVVSNPYEPKPIVSTRSVSTPAIDEKKAMDEKVALEWVEKQTLENVNEVLATFDVVARWLQNDEIVYEGETGRFAQRFNSNPLELTEAQVIETVETYLDPDVMRLRNRIHYEY